MRRTVRKGPSNIVTFAVDPDLLADLDRRCRATGETRESVAYRALRLWLTASAIDTGTDAATPIEVEDLRLEETAFYKGLKPKTH